MKSIQFLSLSSLILLGIISCGKKGVQQGDGIQSSVKTTKSGHKFRPVTVEELVEKHKMTKANAAKFVGSGAFEDESGMIWGDMATIEKDANAPKYMNHEDAKKYCESIGAELPSGYPQEKNGKSGFPNKDSDFVRLSKYMGAKANSNEEYSPQILPNLTFNLANDKTIYNRYFRSLSVDPEYSSYAYFFDGLRGPNSKIGLSGFRSIEYYYSVRCVLGRR